MDNCIFVLLELFFHNLQLLLWVFNLFRIVYGCYFFFLLSEELLELTLLHFFVFFNVSLRALSNRLQFFCPIHQKYSLEFVLLVFISNQNSVALLLMTLSSRYSAWVVMLWIWLKSRDLLTCQLVLLELLSWPLFRRPLIFAHFITFLVF